MEKKLNDKGKKLLEKLVKTKIEITENMVSAEVNKKVKNEK